MVVKNYIEKNRYYDSVFLMKIAGKLAQTEDIDNASIGMGTPLNKETICDLGLDTEEMNSAGPNDLIIAVRAKDEEACSRAKEKFAKLVSERNSGNMQNSFRSIAGAKNAIPDANLAIISVAGEYAAAEAKRALMNDMNVFMFSDNVDIGDEVELKNLALKKDRFMMGPGCGLSFINGAAIGLCSMVNRGDIGLAGASGSGIQTVMVLVHRNGFGISHAIGTGGRDMSDEVGGIAMIQSIKALENDEGTKVIALISKPPAHSALLKVIDVIKKCKKPVVVQFLNGDNKTLAENGIMYTETFDETAKKVMELSEKYGLAVDPDALIEDITVGMQQRTEILKMLYRDNDILIFDEPTAVLTPQEIDELMQIIKNLAAEGKSILFISHKLNEIMAVADRCTVLRKGKYIGTVETANTTMEELSSMMVGRNVSFHVEKGPSNPGDVILSVEDLTVASKVHKNNAVKNASLKVRAGEIVCIAGIDGNGQTEFVHALTGLEPAVSGKITLSGRDITNVPIRQRSIMGMSHIPEDRHKHGLILDYTLEDNLVLQRYFEPEFTDKAGFLRRNNIRSYAEKLIGQYDIRSGQGPITIARSMSGGNQQKAIVAREIDKNPELLVAVQPTRGLDVGAIEYIHKQLVAQRDAGKAVLLVSLELDEVMDVPDRILVMYEGEIVGELDPKATTQEELGLYMAGAKRDEVKA